MRRSLAPSTRRIRRVALYLAAVTIAFAGTQAFTQTNSCSARVASPTGLGSFGGRSPILPETPPPSAKRQKATAVRKSDDRKRKRIRHSQHRKLPSSIPRLSELLQESAGSEARKYTSPSPEKDNRKAHEPSDTTHGHAEPWKASFETSVRTQGRIKKEFATFHDGEAPNHKAKRILNAFLSTPPCHCNAANAVGVLTFSAKALGTRRIEPDDQLRDMLFDALDILHTMVKQRLLSTRQLCNACWAIAKHYDRDETLLPPPPEVDEMSSDHVLGRAERWNVADNANELNFKQQRVDETVDEIAHQLTLILEESEESHANDDTRAPPAKIGEICMASWAYGKLRPRATPPGWQIPPQLGRLPAAMSTAEKLARTSDLITFEQWGSFGEKKEVDGLVESAPATDITGELFDAIAASLCRSPEAMGITHTSDASYQEEDEFSNCLQHCSWSELANVGWSFASHGRCKSIQAQMLLFGIAREARHRLIAGGKAMQDFLVRDIAQLLWALGTLQADNFRLADDLVALVEALSEYLRLGERSPSFERGRPLARWSCADLVQVALSLAHARIDELPLLRTIYEESHHRLLEGMYNDYNEREGRQRFRPWEVSILLWGQARLYLTDEQDDSFGDFAEDASKFFLSALSKSTGTLARSGIGAQEQANIVWSLTVLEQHQSKDAIELIQRIFRETAETCRDQQTIQLEHAHQLWQAYFLLQDESPQSVANVPSWLADYLRDKWNLEKSRTKLSSARHKSLSQTLSLMGVRHFNEHDEDIDVAIVLKGDATWTHQTDSLSAKPDSQLSVAVEFDGPNHFTREKTGTDKSNQPRALGHTVLKYRLLKKQGWTVVRVPYFEFDKIPFWASMVSAGRLLLLA